MENTPFILGNFEPKWAEIFAERGNNFTLASGSGQKSYIIDMFPYPSGSGLHVGHVVNFTGTDVVARFERLRGKNVFHPMGWDAFGLPAENYAIKTGVHPAISTPENIVSFKRQLQRIGISYDWSHEINTSDPEYYKWTQWFFQLLYKRGLAYKKDGAVNWCESCQTALANEQVIGGRCERCGSLVVQRQLPQWYFKITDYAERLLADLDELDWPEKIKAMQRNWIGKSEGAQIFFDVVDSKEKIEVFTTRPDTIYGATYLVLAPEHPLLDQIVTTENHAIYHDYLEQTSKKSDLDRQFLDKSKTGFFTGAYAINPASGEKIQIWAADYVLYTYGTGAIMAVPAHDERDNEFAKQFNLPIVEVIENVDKEGIATNTGILVHSGEFSNQSSEQAVDGILAKIGGKKVTTYRLRDWLVSRQRFWGAPVPVMYGEDGEEVLVPEDQLPVTLPMNVDFKPTGQSPLATATDWRRVTIDGKHYTRDADTLDTFVCSSWYYLRYLTPHLDAAAFDKELVAKWLPVDTYIGGAEHAVLHLMYARFLTKVLFDAGLVNFEEPFTKLRNQGMILGPDHQKMSKSKGNVVNPDDVITEYGTDTLRLFELFLGPFDQEKPWDPKGIVGIRRFLEKVWRLQFNLVEQTAAEKKLLAKTVLKVTADLEENRFNTAISALMELNNGFAGSVSKEGLSVFLRLLSPMAPFITHEMWANLGLPGEVGSAAWPEVNAADAAEDVVTYAVQFNGKVRAQVEISSAITNADEIEAIVLADEKVRQRLEGAIPKRVIVVVGKIVSLIV